MLTPATNGSMVVMANARGVVWSDNAPSSSGTKVSLALSRGRRRLLLTSPGTFLQYRWHVFFPASFLQRVDPHDSHYGDVRNLPNRVCAVLWDVWQRT